MTSYYELINNSIADYFFGEIQNKDYIKELFHYIYEHQTEYRNDITTASVLLLNYDENNEYKSVSLDSGNTYFYFEDKYNKVIKFALYILNNTDIIDNFLYNDTYGYYFLNNWYHYDYHIQYNEYMNSNVSIFRKHILLFLLLFTSIPLIKIYSFFI